MKRRRPRITPPPYPGQVVSGGIVELVSEEEKAGRPVAPPVRLVVPPDAPPEVAEWATAGRPQPPTAPPAG
jgi:hypothetical protein